jgi:hypothetical protein
MGRKDKYEVRRLKVRVMAAGYRNRGALDDRNIVYMRDADR